LKTGEEAVADQFPEKFGKYKIIEKVGRGGFADVYKAVDTTLNRTVALKFLEPRLLREPTFVERFQREAKVAANLDHPNIVNHLGEGADRGGLFHLWLLEPLGFDPLGLR
jgi:serine/threonine protein kinase